jgi:methionyl-tRNA synthetase
LANRLNGELADALGNLANRTLSLIQRNCEGKLPAPAAAIGDDVALLDALAAMPGLVGKHVEDQAFHLALEEVFRVVRAANGYITAQAPWALKKTDLARMEAVLRHLHSVLRGAATALQPSCLGPWRLCSISSPCLKMPGIWPRWRHPCPAAPPCQPQARSFAKSRSRPSDAGG